MHIVIFPFRFHFRPAQRLNQLHPPLVLSRGLLARLQLIQVPSTDRQAALVLIHALPEILDVACAGTGGGGRVDLRVLLREFVGLLLGGGFGRGRGTAEEEVGKTVADGGADGDTTGDGVLVYCIFLFAHWVV